jgi:hypothetical protein
VSQISADSGVFVPSRRRRLLVFGIAIAVVLLLSAATYAGYVLTGAARPVTTIGCYQTDSLEANTAAISAGTKSPVAVCANAYASAFPGTPQPAQFAACVLPSGAVGVFPSTSGDTCKNLGLATVAGTRGNK